MSSTPPRSVVARALPLLTVCSLAASAIRCDYDEYPIDPTFCDRWCRVLSRSGCDQEPENCVRNCERSLAPSACFALQEQLLACYEATPASEFVCSGQGFRQIARPEVTVCPGERDALIECAYPEVESCLDFCRAVDAAYGGDAGGDADAGDGRVCPSHDIPCDSMCWLVAGVFDDGGQPGEENDDAGAPPIDAGAGLEELGAELFACGIERAEACRAAEPAPDGGPAPSANWASVMFDCLDELAF